MKRIVLLSILGAITLSACGGSQSSKVPKEQLEGSGIVSTMRSGDQVTLLYQESSTSRNMLQAQANRACGAIGKSAGNPQSASLGGAKNIPGVDRKVIYSCY